MSTVRTNNILDASGGNTATINSMTPTADSLQGFRNRIINGDMRIDQRNAGASVTPASAVYTLDRWIANVAGSGASKFSVQRSTTAPTGFVNSMLATSTSAYSIASGDITAIVQVIEGFNVADLAWGTANAKTITISFWVRSSLTGTFGGALYNGSFNRSYPFTYTISSANSFEYKTITIAGDTSGTWATNNSFGIGLSFGLGVGSTYSGTAGAWAGALYVSATGATSLVGTNGATFYITGVQLEVGSVATPFERRDYGAELALCQRYYERTADADNYFTSQVRSDTGAKVIQMIPFAVAKRTAPTVSFTTSSFTSPDGLVFELMGGYPTRAVTVSIATTSGIAIASVPSAVVNGLNGGWLASAEL